MLQSRECDWQVPLERSVLDKDFEKVEKKMKVKMKMRKIERESSFTDKRANEQ